MASGDPAPDAVVLWTRLSESDGRAATMTWRVATDPELSRVVAAGETTAAPEADFTVAVAAGGLRPATTYWYGFEAGGVRSPVGRTRTAPAGAVKRLRIGVVSCAHWETGFFNAYGRLAERDVDLVVHLGDSIYEDAARKEGGVRLHRPPDRAVTLADYRGRHGQYRTDPDLRAMYARHPVVAVWDDHELAGNAWRHGAARHDPAVDGEWEARLAAAARAYREWTPMRLPEPADPLRLWRRVPLGDLADLILLDTRLEGRERPAAGRRPVLGVFRRRRALLGEAQWRWLTEQLSGTGGHWRLLASQVVVAPVHLLPGGLVVNPGQWDGYPAERRRLLNLLGGCGAGTVVISGDLHSSWASELRAPHGDAVAAEFSTPAVSAASFARVLAPPVPGGRRFLEAAIRRANPHVRFVDTDGHGYLLLDVTPERIQAQWWHVATVRARHRAERLAATWSVGHGDGVPAAGRPPG